MSFFKSSKKADDVKQGGGSNHITASGCYPVNIIAPVVSDNGKGSTTVDFYVNHEGQKQIIYGNLRITNNEGIENKIGSKIFNQLVIIAGLDDVAEPVEATLPIGAKESDKDVAVLEDLCDIDVFMRVQMEYGMYQGNITEKKVIKAFFRADDKATAEEIVNETEPGAGFERDQKYVNNVTYKDGVTPEQVAAWISGGRKKGDNGSSGSTTEGAKKAPAFGKKRFGKK